MAVGVHGVSGPLAQLLVGVASIPEQGLVTTQRHRGVVTTALPMVQVTAKQKTATPIHAQVRNYSLSI